MYLRTTRAAWLAGWAGCLLPARRPPGDVRCFSSEPLNGTTRLGTKNRHSASASSRARKIPGRVSTRDDDEILPIITYRINDRDNRQAPISNVLTKAEIANARNSRGGFKVVLRNIAVSNEWRGRLNEIRNWRFGFNDRIIFNRADEA